MNSTTSTKLKIWLQSRQRLKDQACVVWFYGTGSPMYWKDCLCTPSLYFELLAQDLSGLARGLQVCLDELPLSPCQCWVRKCTIVNSTCFMSRPQTGLFLDEMLLHVGDKKLYLQITDLNVRAWGSVRIWGQQDGSTNWMLLMYTYRPAAGGEGLPISRARQSLHAGVRILGYDQFLIIPTPGSRSLPPADKKSSKSHHFSDLNFSTPFFKQNLQKMRKVPPNGTPVGD